MADAEYEEATNSDIKDLIRRLSETEATLQHILDSQEEALVDPLGGTPIVLKQAQHTLSEFHARYSRLSHRMTVLIFELTPGGTVTFANGAVTRITGYTAGELLGRNWWEVFYPGPSRTPAEALIAELNSGDVTNFETQLCTRSGEPVFVEISTANLYDDGALTKVIGCALDITDRKHAEQARHESEDRFRLMAETIQDVFWMSKPGITEMIYVSPAYETLWGRSRESLYRAPHSFIDAIHPQDQDRVRSGIAQHAKGVWDFEYRIVCPDGEVRWIRDRGFPINDDEGRLRMMTGVATDITERKRMEEQLKQASIVFENTAEAIIITDAARRIIAVNNAFTRITGYTSAEVVGRNPRVLQSGRQDEAFYQSLWDILALDGYWQGEIWNRHKSGEIFPVWESISVVKDEQGRITHFISLFTDISRFKQAEERLTHLAHHDALTGLPNRLLFSANLDKALERARRHKQSLAVMYLDLDRFKAVNDNLGHASGDKLLQIVAERLRHSLRAEDTVARVGGDEFTVVLDEISHREDAAHVAAKLIDATAVPVRLDDQHVDTSISVGIALFPDDADTAEALLKVADEAMYLAKQGGRHTYRFYSAPALNPA